MIEQFLTWYSNLGGLERELIKGISIATVIVGVVSLGIYLIDKTFEEHGEMERKQRELQNKIGRTG